MEYTNEQLAAEVTNLLGDGYTPLQRELAAARMAADLRAMEREEEEGDAMAGDRFE